MSKVVGSQGEFNAAFINLHFLLPKQPCIVYQDIDVSFHVGIKFLAAPQNLINVAGKAFNKLLDRFLDCEVQLKSNN